MSTTVQTLASAAAERAATRPYRIPSIQPEAVGLDDFSTAEIREYLQREGSDDDNHEGHHEDGPYEVGLTSEFVDRIRTLAMCGQRDAAIAELVEEFSRQTERPL